jgi:hypothetical protein
VRKPGDRVTRAAFADMLFPGVVRDQRRKLSRRLSELKNHDLPKPLAQRIRVDGEFVSLDLAGCDSDVGWLLTVASEIVAAGGLLSDGLCESAEKARRLAAEEFLPGWEEVERRGTGGGSGMTDVVEDVRDRVVTARMAILDALAEARLVRQQPGEAIPYLEEALRCRPERAQLARKLADVHERSGQPQRAAAIRQEYGLNEAS